MLLTNGNTEFAQSVTRGALHFKSGDLQDLLTALSACQKSRTRETVLALLKAFHLWVANNPQEAKHRGARVPDLVREIGNAYIDLFEWHLIDKGNRDFEKSVTRGGLHYKSSRLKRVLAALNSFQAGYSPESLRTLRKQLQAWKHADPHEFKDRGVLAWALFRMTTRYAEHYGIALNDEQLVDDAPPPGPDGNSAQNIARVLHAAKAELDRCKQFVSLDATQFAGNINPARRDEIIARTRNYRGAPSQVFNAPPKWSLPALTAVRNAVYNNKMGECTSFGAAAAAIIGKQAGPLPRIEYVAFRGGVTHMHTVSAHCFCIVGREGGYRPGGRWLDSTANWGSHWAVVDPWAAAMGYEAVFHPQGAGYPDSYRGFLRHCEALMEYPGD